MNRFNVRKERGFSLVELMIVVAIIAILAAIAIPAFMRFAIKSKTAEATGNLSGIRTCEEAYRAENDVYIIAAPTPTGGGTDSTPDEWTGGGIAWFTKIGFEPDGNVRYSYEIVLGTDGTVLTGNEITGAFKVIATSDLDEDGTDGIFTLDSGAPGYPKPVFVGTY